MIFSFAICFRRPRYRVFRYQSCFFTTAKTCSTLARTEDFSRSWRLICARERVDAFFALGWTAVDLITNSLSLMIADNGMLSFFSAQIPAVAIYNRFFAGQKLCHHGHIVHVGTAALYRMNQSAILIYTDVGLVSKVPCIALFHGMCLRISLFFSVLCGRERGNQSGVHYASFFGNRPRSCSSPTTANFGIVLKYLQPAPGCWIPRHKSQTMPGYPLPPPRFPHPKGYTDFVAHKDAASTPDRRACFRALLCTSTAAQF